MEKDVTAALKEEGVNIGQKYSNKFFDSLQIAHVTQWIESGAYKNDQTEDDKIKYAGWTNEQLIFKYTQRTPQERAQILNDPFLQPYVTTAMKSLDQSTK